ncbi:proteasome assembly chaperone 4 isoform X2 [Leopardus geoffroyi]|uniref:proteasome assembly chaperone 4 isoform X2 n=1 Tax=Leopardus geoffroyi TaxID=46844 RepID=UPI001E2631C6|nr:proteasome assembly chaperone 4 isoform X2 [Leopardus geoffroyi]
MDGPPAAAGGDVSLHNFSARLWEQLVHFHVMRLTDSLFLWVGATPHLRNLAVAMCNRYLCDITYSRRSTDLAVDTDARPSSSWIPSPCLPPSSETLLIRPPLALPSA